MKILLTSDQYAPTVSGVVTSVLNLQRALERQGHSVRVLTLSPDVRGRREGDVWELTAWGPDIVHSQCEFSTFPLAKRIARACGAPLLHTCHTVYEDYTHYFCPSRRCGRWLVRVFTRRVAAGCDMLIAPTPKIEALLRGYGVSAPVRVLPTGIEMDAFTRPPAPAAQAALRAALGIPAGNGVLVFAGRLAKEKHIGELLACRAALGDVPVTLLLVGDGPARLELERKAAALGLAVPQVVFAGMAPPAGIAAYYRLGDVFLSASVSETQGLTYLEAMACGLPLVCRADGCLAGVLQNGRNGWQYRTVDECLAHVRALLQNGALRRQMGAHSAAIARERYSAQAFGEGAQALYRELLAQKAAPVKPPALP